MNGFTTFLNAYIDAIEFLEGGATDADGEDLSVSFDKPSLELIAFDCKRFWAKHGDEIEGLDLEIREPYYPEAWASHAGHDFWLTRNGHGAGFWDGDWDEQHTGVKGLAERLNETAEEFGEVYSSSEMRIYLESAY